MSKDKEVEVSKYFKDFKISKVVFSYIFNGIHKKTDIELSFTIDNKQNSIDFLYYEKYKKQIESLNKREKEEMFKEILKIKNELFTQVSQLN